MLNEVSKTQRTDTVFALIQVSNSVRLLKQNVRLCSPGLRGDRKREVVVCVLDLIAL